MILFYLVICYALDKELNNVANFYLDQVREFDRKVALLENEVNDERQQQLLQTSVDGKNKTTRQVEIHLALLDQFKGVYQEVGYEFLELQPTSCHSVKS